MFISTLLLFVYVFQEALCHVVFVRACDSVAVQYCWEVYLKQRFNISGVVIFYGVQKAGKYGKYW